MTTTAEKLTEGGVREQLAWAHESAERRPSSQTCVMEFEYIEQLSAEWLVQRAALRLALPVLKDAAAAEALLDHNNLGVFQGVNLQGALTAARRALGIGDTKNV